MLTKIDINDKNILFLGYGAVAKCVWNYFDHYFHYDQNRVFAVDQFPSSFTGPRVELLQCMVEHISATTFDTVLDTIGMTTGDIIIDLTYDSATYYFIKRSLERGIHYMNTSIEDRTDAFHGSSIAVQQHHVGEIMRQFESEHPYTSTILTECGQNPGVIQHYVFHALDCMNQLSAQPLPLSQAAQATRMNLYREIIRQFQVGTIFCSEMDDQVMDIPINPDVITNTWSVSGFLSEAMDPTEVVRSTSNPFIQPVIAEEMRYTTRMQLYPYANTEPYEVVFLKEMGVHTTIPSICPVITPQGIVYKTYQGKMIHHGELFDLARHFGKDTPFMSYVYQNNPYMDQSLHHFFSTRPDATPTDIIMYANQEHHFRVLDQRDCNITGQDSIGATLFCGKEKIDRIFWCGSIVTHTDANLQPYFTPTILQVAAGVLSGLSYIMEQPRLGWLQSSDIDTTYMLEKCKPLLGSFFFTEIPVGEFTESLTITTRKSYI